MLFRRLFENRSSPVRDSQRSQGSKADPANNCFLLPVQENRGSWILSKGSWRYRKISSDNKAIAGAQAAVKGLVLSPY